MGVFDSFLDAVNLKDDEDDYEEEYDEEEEEPRSFRRKRRDSDSSEKASNITPIRSRSGSSSQTSKRKAAYSVPDEMAVVVIKPTAYNDIQEIADTLLSGRTVVLNTEGLDMNLAQRIIDFMSGTCYAVQGAFQKISNFIFIITPKGVEISGDVAQMVDDLSASAAGGSRY